MAQRIELESITKDVWFCWGTVYHNTDNPDSCWLAMSMFRSIGIANSNDMVNTDPTDWNNGVADILERSPTTGLKATSLQDAMMGAKFEEEMFDVD